MKKAVITTGSHQYLVTEGQEIEVELLHSDKAKIEFAPLLVIDEKQIEVGEPEVKNATVTAEIITEDVQNDKVTSIRYKAKKRVHTVRGHRQHKTVLKITKISTKA
jgi:large subunit ribosomal protein L21